MRLHVLLPVLLLLPLATSRAEEATIPTVIVTATRTAQAASEGLASVTVITREDIERRQALSVQDVLRGLPGVQISTSGGLGKATSVFLRGANEDQVLVLIDGVKVGSATLGTAAFENLPVEEIERIDIVRGPRSSLYGSEAVGGVIHVITRRGSGSISPSLTVGGGSFDTRRAAAGISGGDSRSWFNLSASRLQTGGYDVHEGVPPERDADGYENTAVALRAGRRFGDAVEAEMHVLHSDGFTEFDGSFVNEADLLQQVLGAKIAVRAAPFWWASLTAGSSVDEQENFRDGTPRTRFDSHRDTLSFLNDVALGNARLLTLGIDLHRDRVASTTAFTETRRDNAGVFVQLATGAGAQDFLFAARYDDNEQFGSVTTGSAAWGWAPSAGVRVRASFGTAFKAPTLNQLYFPGFGNPTLEAERSQSAEIGALVETRFGEWSASAHRSAVDDLILFDPVTFFPENIASARIHGVELGWSRRLGGWRVDAALDVIDAENRSAGADRGNRLPRRAREMLSLAVHRELARARLGARLVAEGRRYEDLANRIPLSGFATLDLLGEYALNRNWLLQLRIENAFDRRYRTAATFNQPGRGAFVTLRYQPAARDPSNPQAHRGETT